MNVLRRSLVGVEDRLHRQLVLHSVSSLRVAVGAILLAFGVLKFFPDVSPAQDLATTTTDELTFGLVPASAALLGVAVLECFVGICLVVGRWMRLAIWLLAVQLMGILAPLVLLPERLFAGPHGAPTLEGQYVLKDVVLVAAAMVIAAGTFRGGRMVREEATGAAATSTGRWHRHAPARTLAKG